MAGRPVRGRRARRGAEVSSRPEVAARGGGTLREELDCLGVAAVREGIARRQRQRRHAEDRFALHPQRLARGGQDVELRTGAQQSVHEVGAGCDEMLAIVEHQQQATCADGVDQELE